MKERWNLWLDIDPIFPWDWTKDDRLIGTDSNINGANYLTQLYYWGNEESDGIELFGEKARVVGPSGFLNKFGDRREELEESGYICQGVDTTRCPWPMGINS